MHSSFANDIHNISCQLTKTTAQFCVQHISAIWIIQTHIRIIKSWILEVALLTYSVMPRTEVKCSDNQTLDSQSFTVCSFLSHLHIVQPRLSEHAGTRQKCSDNWGWLYTCINTFMRGPRRNVRIIECSDNQSSDNRGFTVCILVCWRYTHVVHIISTLFIRFCQSNYM